MTRAEYIKLLQETPDAYFKATETTHRTGERRANMTPVDNIYERMSENGFEDVTNLGRSDEFAQVFIGKLKDDVTLARVQAEVATLRADSEVEDEEERDCALQGNGDWAIEDLEGIANRWDEVLAEILADAREHCGDPQNDDLLILADALDLDIEAWAESAADEVDTDFYESLAYWTVYQRTGGIDPDVATRCGLTVFEYEDNEYLALGGCGMDLTPKLDAYCALSWGYIPDGSDFFRQPDYFKYVAGDSVTADVEQATRITDERIITAYLSIPTHG